MNTKTQKPHQKNPPRKPRGKDQPQSPLRQKCCHFATTETAQQRTQHSEAHQVPIHVALGPMGRATHHLGTSLWVNDEDGHVCEISMCFEIVVLWNMNGI